MPGFINTTSGGCVCPEGRPNVNGICATIKTGCDSATLTILPNTTDGTTVTVSDISTISLSFSESTVASRVNVLMRPEVSVRTKPASNATTLLGLEQVVPGMVPGQYEIELEGAAPGARS